MRRVLSNILLLLFRYHPNGVLQCELCTFYQQMFGEQLIICTDVEYLMCVHRCIQITSTRERGKLYTLQPQSICNVWKEFDAIVLKQWIIKHVRRLFRFFPNGIDFKCFEKLLFNMVGFCISNVIKDWCSYLIDNVPLMQVPVSTSTSSVDTLLFIENPNEMIKDISAKYNIQLIEQYCNWEQFLSTNLDARFIVTTNIGYNELLITSLVLLEMESNGECIENLFHKRYQSRLVHESPIIQHILQTICVVSYKDSVRYYRLSTVSMEYFNKNIDVFLPILVKQMMFNTKDKSNEQLHNIINSSFPSSIIPLNMMIMQNNLHNMQIQQRTSAASLGSQNPSSSPYEEDQRSLFMGGFAHGTRIYDLKLELKKLGVEYIHSSGISFRNYGWSFVTVATVEQAKYLIKISPITICNRNIDVRPFIDRQRVKNHTQNRPSDSVLIEALLDIFQRQFAHKFRVHLSIDCIRCSSNILGLKFADIQPLLFRRFKYRIDGPELTKLIGDHPLQVYIKRSNNEKIYLTPKMDNAYFNYSNLTVQQRLKDFKNKINKLWLNISDHYRTLDDKLQESLVSESRLTKMSVSDFENEYARKYHCIISPIVYNTKYATVEQLLFDLHRQKVLPFEPVTDEKYSFYLSHYNHCGSGYYFFSNNNNKHFGKKNIKSDVQCFSSPSSYVPNINININNNNNSNNRLVYDGGGYVQQMLDVQQYGHMQNMMVYGSGGSGYYQSPVLNPFNANLQTYGVPKMYKW